MKMLRLVTIHAPLGGYYCGLKSNCGSFDLPDWLMELAPLIYTDIVQKHVGPAGYWRDPYNIDLYAENARSLPILDNINELNQTIKNNFLSIDKLVVFVSIVDDVIRPRSSSRFDTWADDDGSTLFYKDRDVYINDTFGLRTLDELGRFIVIEESYPHSDLLYDFDFVDNILCPHLLLDDK